MLISVVNRSRKLSDAELQRAVRAVNRQFAEDFEPHWQFGARLRLDGCDERAEAAEDHRPLALRRLPGRRGDAVIYVMDAPTVADAEGYHDRNAADVPVGFVFLEVCAMAGDEWQVALSHEAIELVADPLNNLLVQGPHPRDRRRLVFHMFELCDAVQGETYELDGVPVSNFVLPGWFTRGDAPGVRNDFLGRPKRDQFLPSFGLAPGGYVCFWDAAREEHERWTSVTLDGDAAGLRRMAAKGGNKLARLQRRQHGR